MGLTLFSQSGPQTSNAAAQQSGIRAEVPATLMPDTVAVLYDQINNPAPTPGGVTSQDFEAANNAFDSEAADDFVVPGGQVWTINIVQVVGEYTTGPAAGVNIVVYGDNGAN